MPDESAPATPGNILIADDNPLNLRLLAGTLASRGYVVRLVRDSRMVLPSALAHLPDLILLDIMMPGLDGFQVCTQLKAEPRTAEIPVIFISALHEVTEKVKAFTSGGIDYITKPFQSEEVLARVKTHLSLYHLKKVLEEKNQQLEDAKGKLQDSNQNLEQRIREEVEHRRSQEQLLVQQSKMAAMGEMIGAIVHQWRQPLNTVGILAQDLLDAMEYGELDQVYLEGNVNGVMQQVQFMSQTLEDFRAFFKPEKRKIAFDLYRAVSEVVNLVKPQFVAGDIEIGVENRCASPLTLGYPNEFKQVLLIFLNNSKDAILARRAREGKMPGAISIRLEEQDDGLHLNFLDNGGGISDAVMAHLFEPYVTSKGEEGTGIGLYMSRIIIEDNMDGRLSARNREQGAEFRIVLPKGRAP